MKNIYYFKYISKIGGIETFLYQLVRKFPNEIMILCDDGDLNQLNRLNSYCEIQFYKPGTKYKCDKAFFNFNLDAIDDIEANEYNLVIHGNYSWLECKPPKHGKITHVYAVSNNSAEAYTKLTGIPCEVIYNPLEIYSKKALLLMSATRIDISTEKIKGGDRMIKLSHALDTYCSKHNATYKWLCFTDKPIPNCNIDQIKPSLDVVSFIPKFDYVIQLSDQVEGFNYTINESLVQGVPIVATKCPAYIECGVTDDMAIWVDFDCSNLDEVVEQMFNRKFKFNYSPPKSEWDKLLNHEKGEIKKLKKFLVKATDKWQIGGGIHCDELDHIPRKDEQFIVTEGRFDILNGNNKYGVKFVELVEQVPEQESLSLIEDQMPGTVETTKRRKKK